MTKALGINGDVQLNLFEGLSDTGASRQSRRAAGRVFIDPDPQQLYLGQLSVKAHLQAAGIRGPLVLRALLSELDWSGFEDNYARTGRAPYSPRSVLGLIVYGLLQGVSSLRGLERLARVDIGAMWVSGGICPDHANIGRFITQHDELLSGSFFIVIVNRPCVTSHGQQRDPGGGRRHGDRGGVFALWFDKGRGGETAFERGEAGVGAGTGG